MIKPWKVKQTAIVHTTPWIEIVQDDCVADTIELSYTYTRRIDEGPLIIAESNLKSLWLVRQYRHPIKKIVWQFPVEGKKTGESWEDAARRGVEEELHLRASHYKDLGEFYPDPGGLDQKYHAFLAQGLEEISELSMTSHSDPAEHLEVGSFTLNEIDVLIQTGEICDNWTLAGLYLYQRNLQ